MFSDRTFENILNELLATVPSEVDKRQGSVIYDTLAPAAAKMAQQYIDIQASQDTFYLDTAPIDSLKRRGANEFNTPIIAAVNAQRAATFTGATPIAGTRFLADNIYWTLLANGNIQAEVSGIIGNRATSGINLVPLTTIQGLTAAMLGDIVIPGSAEEGLEPYRARLIAHLRTPELNSNAAQIRAWARSRSGVGDARIFSLWNGPNTVRAVVIDTQRIPASDTIVSSVQQYIEPIDESQPTLNRGLGNGQADIGVIFTAQKATALNINIVATIQLLSGKSLSDANTEAIESIEAYLRSIAFLSQTSQDVVRFAEISATLLNTESIRDVTALTVNEGTGNVSVDLDNVAVRGTITLTTA